MKNKNLLLIFAGLMLIAAFSGLTSAAVAFVNTANTATTVMQGNSVIVSFQAKESGQGNLANITFNTPITLAKDSSNPLNSVSIISGVIPSLNQNTTSGSMSLAFNVPPNQPIGTYTGNLILSGKYTNDTNYSFFSLPIILTVTQSSTNNDDFKTSGNFCVYSHGVSENQGNLGVSIHNLDVKSGSGSGGKWYPFDEVEFEIKVENNDANDDVTDISLEWGIYDQDAGDWIKEVSEEDNFDLSDGDEDTYTISLTVDESDLDVDLTDLDRNHNYIIYARIIGDIDQGDFKGNRTCDYTSRDIEMIIDRDFVTLTDFKVPDTVSCGDTLTISANTWNIGTRDQDKITVGVAVKDLGDFKKIFDVGSINSFDSKKVDFQIPIPQNTTPKSYIASFYVYDEDSNVFENKNNDEAIYSILFKVGSCSTPSETGDTVVVSADLASGGKAGQPLSINAVITNTGNKQLLLSLNAVGFAQWANSVNLDKDSLTLSPGQSGNVKFVFDVKEDASGDQLFNIEATSGNQLVANQPVSIFITGSKTSLSGLFGDNWYLWVLGLVNLVLVILIIVVAIRVTRKNKIILKK
ncbi:MAG: putative S-layer protein [Nanoarchaeota archaeon]